MPIFEALGTQSGSFFLQLVSIVRLHTLLLDPRLDKFVLCMRHKRVVGIIL